MKQCVHHFPTDKTVFVFSGELFYPCPLTWLAWTHVCGVIKYRQTLQLNVFSVNFWATVNTWGARRTQLFRMQFLQDIEQPTVSCNAYSRCIQLRWLDSQQWDVYKRQIYYHHSFSSSVCVRGLFEKYGKKQRTRSKARLPLLVTIHLSLIHI